MDAKRRDHWAENKKQRWMSQFKHKQYLLSTLQCSVLSFFPYRVFFFFVAKCDTDVYLLCFCLFLRSKPVLTLEFMRLVARLRPQGGCFVFIFQLSLFDFSISFNFFCWICSRLYSLKLLFLLFKHGFHRYSSIYVTVFYVFSVCALSEECLVVLSKIDLTSSIKEKTYNTLCNGQYENLICEDLRMEYLSTTNKKGK